MKALKELERFANKIRSVIVVVNTTLIQLIKLKLLTFYFKGTVQFITEVTDLTCVTRGTATSQQTFSHYCFKTERV